MILFTLIASLILILNVAIVLSQLKKNNSNAIYLIMLQLFSTNGIALILLLSISFNQVAIIDVGLTMAVLAGVSVLVYVRNISFQKNHD